MCPFSLEARRGTLKIQNATTGESCEINFAHEGWEDNTPSQWP